MPATYAFVAECAKRWGVEIHTVSAPGGFDELIRKRSYLPNPVARFCTSDLKIKPMAGLMRGLGHESWANVVGLRYDDPRRVAKARAKEAEAWEDAFPLYEARVTRDDVMAFWDAQPFDLHLRWWESNCSLCFMKSRNIRSRIMRDHPETAAWWIEKEAQIGATFRPDEVSYAALFRKTQAQPLLLDVDEASEPRWDCVCTD